MLFARDRFGGLSRPECPNPGGDAAIGPLRTLNARIYKIGTENQSYSEEAEGRGGVLFLQLLCCYIRNTIGTFGNV
jgi:hypothetical protein